MKPISARYCPKDASGEVYIRHCEMALDDGREPNPPETPEQLEALVEWNPRLGRKYLPGPDDLVRMGLSPMLGRDPAPLSEEWQERFLCTLRDDEQFRLAFRHILDRGTA
jgi:hypothetical protein